MRWGRSLNGIGIVILVLMVNYAAFKLHLYTIAGIRVARLDGVSLCIRKVNTGVNIPFLQAPSSTAISLRLGIRRLINWLSPSCCHSVTPDARYPTGVSTRLVTRDRGSIADSKTTAHSNGVRDANGDGGRVPNVVHPDWWAACPSQYGESRLGNYGEGPRLVHLPVETISAGKVTPFALIISSSGGLK